MKNAVALACTLVRRTGAATLVRRTVARRRVSLLLYHDPSPATLERHLEYLSTRYNGVTLTEVIAAMQGSRWGSLPDYPIVITFDDGWLGNVECLSLCRRHGFPVTVFACSSIVDTNRHFWWTATAEHERLKPLPTTRRLQILAEHGFDQERDYPDRQALSGDELRMFDRWVEVGAHTRFHALLTACSDSEAWNEIEGSRKEVEALTKEPCRHFAYPNGWYGRRETELVRKAGFQSARSLTVGWNTPATDPYQLRLLGTPDDAGVDRLAADLSGAGVLYRPLTRLLRRSPGMPA